MRCDDYKRGAITDPSQDCPPNTQKEDYFKCKPSSLDHNLPLFSCYQHDTDES